jgi:hypothetical protein
VSPKKKKKREKKEILYACTDNTIATNHMLLLSSQNVTSTTEDMNLKMDFTQIHLYFSLNGHMVPLWPELPFQNNYQND